MYILFILFFLSLIAITFMILRKTFLLARGQVEKGEGVLFEIPHPREIRTYTVKSARKYGYLALVAIIKLYVYVEMGLKKAWGNIKNGGAKYFKREDGAEPQTSKFLKMVSEYKGRVREIKDKIKEEEKI